MDLKRCKELNAAGLPVALAPDQMIALIEEVERLRRLLLKAFIAGCDAGQKYGSNPFERDRQFDYFMADLKQADKGNE